MVGKKVEGNHGTYWAPYICLRLFLPKKETDRVVIMFFKVMSAFLSMVLENLVTQSPHNYRYENIYSLGFGVLPKLN